jgi:hypothetical protein
MSLRTARRQHLYFCKLQSCAACCSRELLTYGRHGAAAKRRGSYPTAAGAAYDNRGPSNQTEGLHGLWLAL